MTKIFFQIQRDDYVQILMGAMTKEEELKESSFENDGSCFEDLEKKLTITVKCCYNLL